MINVAVSPESEAHPSYLTMHRLRNELDTLASHHLVKEISMLAGNQYQWQIIIDIQRGVKLAPCATNTLELSPIKKRRRTSPTDDNFPSLEDSAAAYDTTEEGQCGGAWIFSPYDPHHHESPESHDWGCFSSILPHRVKLLNECPRLLITFPPNYPFQSPDILIDFGGKERMPICTLLNWTPAFTASDIVQAVIRFLR
ncbi:sensory transduction histidine kinase [Perkinsela sp. CCAP 1560/4]|nr:sensory transduction histidine kinase [Perkinsela sp. CCAP 1560/4]|eukprot:KNH07475.1 sensory transduction histidine kinase [Perkinsela sp. CCAP 1560/4]